MIRFHFPLPLLMQKINFRNEIIGLRAIAIIAVIFFHLGNQYFDGGFVGVDIFFVISGYLISSILFNNLKINKRCFN